MAFTVFFGVKKRMTIIVNHGYYDKYSICCIYCILYNISPEKVIYSMLKVSISLKLIVKSERNQARKMQLENLYKDM